MLFVFLDFEEQSLFLFPIDHFLSSQFQETQHVLFLIAHK